MSDWENTYRELVKKNIILEWIFSFTNKDTYEILVNIGCFSALNAG